MIDTCNAHFYNHLTKVEKTVNDLSAEVKELIQSFDLAKESWDNADKKTKEQLLDALIQSDAFISALIDKVYPLSESEPSSSVDKVKLMALKAKALQVKWKLKNPNT